VIEPVAQSYAARLAADTLTIFLFHGVVERHEHVVRNYTRKHIARARFAAILDALRATGTPVSLDDVIEVAAGQGRLPERAFAITFDDGFRNNLSIAAPLLVERRIPATFYLTTGFIEYNWMSWIDRIEYAIECTGEGRLVLPTGERRFDDAASTQALLDEIRIVVKDDPRIEPDRFATEVQATLGVNETRATDDPLDRKLDWAEVRALAAEPLFSVGGHSHSHANLAFLDMASLARELETSRALLAARAGVSCRHYSYPEGTPNAYSPAVIEALKRIGVQCCPTAEDGVNRPPFDLFRLKRVMVV
jgi:peptidoglycan/xylan/chitin deacetylase (PgdA/CDA1 family)